MRSYRVPSPASRSSATQLAFPIRHPRALAFRAGRILAETQHALPASTVAELSAVARGEMQASLASLSTFVLRVEALERRWRERPGGEP